MFFSVPRVSNSSYYIIGKSAAAAVLLLYRWCWQLTEHTVSPDEQETTDQGNSTQAVYQEKGKMNKIQWVSHEWFKGSAGPHQLNTVQFSDKETH